MKLEKQNTPKAIFTELVRRLARRRIDLGLTQVEASEQAGIAVRTLRRLERGGDCQFLTIIRLLKTYNLVGHLDQHVPEPTISPIEFLERQQKTRKRASKTTPKEKNQPWKWGDEQ